MTYLIYDLAIAALLLFFLWQGYRKGFVLTLCGLLALLVAFIGATVVSNVLAEPVSRTLSPMVEQHLQQVFEEHISDMSQPPDLSLGDLSAELSDLDIPISDLLEALKESRFYRNFTDSIQEAVDSGMVAASADTARVLAGYIAKQLAQTVLFFVSFILILILWFFLSHALDLAFRLPVLSTLNRWSGALLSLAEGVLLVYVACWLLKGRFLPAAALEQSYLLNLFCTTRLSDLLS